MSARATPGVGEGARPARSPSLAASLAIGGAVLLLASLALVGWTYHRLAMRDLVALTSAHSVAVDRVLANDLWTHYGDFLREASHLRPEALRARPELEGIRAMVAGAIRETPILKVKVYGPDGMTIFSTAPQEIGQHHRNSEGLHRALAERRPVSQLSENERFSPFSGEAFERDVVETYLPVIGASGSVEGVVEIYADVTAERRRIAMTTLEIAGLLLAIFAVAWGILVFGVVRRALAPVHCVAGAAARIGPDASGARLPEAGLPREIVPLVRAVNGALDRLDRALEAQRRFTADAAHELMTPLALLRAECAELADRAAASRFEDQLDRMAEMVRELLYLAEIEGREGAPETLGAADLAQAARQVVTMLAPAAIRAGREVALVADGVAVPVRGTPGMLERMLTNLVENALAHTPPGTAVEVEVEAAGRVRVRDRGPGIPEAEREMIFRRFWRGARAGCAGTGLGLAIVARIVALAGGRIEVADAPGGGAVFTVELPLAGDEEGPRPGAESRA